MLGRDVDPLPGFSTDHPGYDEAVHGKVVPPGRATVHNVAFEDAGKQYMYKCGLNECVVQLAAFNGLTEDVEGDASSRLPGDGIGLNDHSGVRAAITPIEIVGCVSVSPRTGLLVQGFPAVELRDSLLMGHELVLMNTDATVDNNVFLVSTDQITNDNPNGGSPGECTMACSESDPIQLMGGGALRFLNNRVMWGYTGITVDRGCEGIALWIVTGLNTPRKVVARENFDSLCQLVLTLESVLAALHEVT